MNLSAGLLEKLPSFNPGGRHYLHYVSQETEPQYRHYLCSPRLLFIQTSFKRQPRKKLPLEVKKKKKTYGELSSNEFVSFYCCIVFHGLDTPQYIYPFTS